MCHAWYSFTLQSFKFLRLRETYNANNSWTRSPSQMWNVPINQGNVRFKKLTAHSEIELLRVTQLLFVTGSADVFPLIPPLLNVAYDQGTVWKHRLPEVCWEGQVSFGPCDGLDGVPDYPAVDGEVSIWDGGDVRQRTDEGWTWVWK